MVRNKCSTALYTVWAYHQLLCSWLPSTLWFTWAAATSARAWATQSQPISSVGRSPQSQRDLTDELCGLQSTCAGMWEGAQTRPQGQREQLPSFLWKYCRLTLTQASLKPTLGLSLLQAQPGYSWEWFFYNGCSHHLTALCPWQREWKPAIVRTSHWRADNIPCHLKGESQS